MRWLLVAFGFFPILAQSAAPCSESEKNAPLQTSSLEELVDQIQANTCSFPGIEHEAEATGARDVRILVQLGFVDQTRVVTEKNRERSFDKEIIKGVEEYFLENCGFAKDSGHLLTKKYPAGFTLRILLVPSSKQGRYDQDTSSQNIGLLQSRLAQSDYFVYLGHSRHGKGMDFYPWQEFRGKNALPIYSEKFFEDLPSTIKGVGILGCDSSSYSDRRGATYGAKKTGIRLYAQEQKTFNFQESVSELLKALQAL